MSMDASLLTRGKVGETTQDSEPAQPVATDDSVQPAVKKSGRSSGPGTSLDDATVMTDKSEDDSPTIAQHGPKSGDLESSGKDKVKNTDEPRDRSNSPDSTGSRNALGALNISKPHEQDPVRLDEDSKPEIQHIMDQFHDKEDEPTAMQELSPSASALPIFQYPPRSSSLDHLQKDSPDASIQQSAPRSGSMSEPEKTSLSRTSTVSQPPLPEPEPEPDLPFDFQRFLEQLRHRTADPVAKFLRSFLQEFGKKQWMVHEQVKIVGDFLSFISGRMSHAEVWRNVSEAEFDNAKEGMEKLVMNRLYVQTFAPEIPPPEPVKSRKKGPITLPSGPGRRGQHQEDVERDEVLAQKIRIYGWVKEEHLDIKPFDEKGQRFIKIAQQELAKIKSYRAPRDKVICVLNSCKVLFGFLRTAHSEQSADAFIPLLIYTVLKANPEHLVSNMQYILRFRNPDKLNGEAGYYMSSLMGAVQFIENLDRTSLTVSDEDFEKNVEQAVSAIAERRSREDRRASSQLPFNEKSLPSRPEVTPRHSMDAEQISPRRRHQGNSSVGTDMSSGTESEDNAVNGLLRTIQKPLNSIGRMFSDDTTASQGRVGNSQSLSQQNKPQMRPPAGVSSAASAQYTSELPPGAVAQETRQQIAATDIAARQASVETAEAHRLSIAEYQTIVDTLCGMFPSLDKDVIGDIVRMKQGRVGLAVDACLALSR